MDNLRRQLFHTLYCICAWVLLPVSALQAQFQVESHAQLELIAETNAIVPGEVLNLAVQFEIDPHWHIYWENPGSSGLPPEITWDLPDGFVVGAIQWPAPERIELEGLVSYSYEDLVTLIVPVQVPESLNVGEVVKIGAEVAYLICENVCLPGDASLSLELPVADSSSPSEQAGLFEAARETHPSEAPWSVSSSIEDGELVLQIEAGEGAPIPASLYYYSLPKELTDPDAAQVFTFVGESTARLAVPLGFDFDPEKVDQIGGVLQSSDASWSVSAELKDVLTLSGDHSASGSIAGGEALGFEGRLLNLGLPGWLVLSFLGGFILNFMPCVLPVLSLKVFSLLKHSGQTRAQAVAHGGAYTLGVVVSFLLLGAALLILRSLGEQIGWGFQLQSPGFVVVLTMLFFLFGLNLMGVFEIGVGLVGADASISQRSDLVGSFGMGVLAAVVGAPCMGPLVASVSGIAIQGTVLNGLLIFSVMGLGLASPFMFLAVFPKLVSYLPKPGLWMETFKQSMGFLLMVAVVFLIWVIGSQGGESAILAVLVALLVSGFAGWIYGRWNAPVKPQSVRRVAWLITFALVIGAGFYGVKKASNAYAGHSAQSSDSAEGWDVWSPERVDEELAAGHAVFVDFTATWCLICQVNKVPLHSEEVETLFEAHGVVPLEADWTRRDSVITEVLEKYKRAGVPLYLLYSPDGEVKVLPQNLTKGIVRDAVESLLK